MSLFPKFNSEFLSITFLFFISLAIRLYLLFEFPHIIFLHEADAPAYFSIAKGIAENWELLGTHFPPFYPFLIAIASAFTDDIEIAGRVVSSIMGALLVFPVYFIGKELYNKRVGYLSAIIIVFFGDFIESSLSPLTQTTYLTLMLSGVYLGVILIVRRSPLLFFLLGLICGALYLTRPEGFLFFVYISMIVLTSVLLDCKTALKERIKAISLLFIGFLILAMPYINYLHNQTGNWYISGKAAAALITVDGMAKLLPTGETVGSSSRGQIGIFDYYSNAADFFAAYWGNFIQFAKLLPERFSLIYLIIIFVGITTSLIGIVVKKDAVKVKALQLCILFGCFVAVLPVFIFNISKAPSYILPIFPVLIIWLSKGLLVIEGGAIKVLNLIISGKVERLRQWMLVSTAIVILFSYSSFLPFFKNMSSNDFRYYAASQKFFLKDTGEWLKYNTQKDAFVMTRWVGNIGFYADRACAGLVDGEISEVVKYAKKHNVSYIVIDSASVPRRRPKLEPLLNPSMGHFGLMPVYVAENYSILVIIYKVL